MHSVQRKLTDPPQGVNPPNASRDTSRGVAPEPESDSELSPHAASKSVAFTPLSPQSSRTLRKHHAEQEAHRLAGESRSRERDDPDADEDDSAVAHGDDRSVAARTRNRRGSDPSSNRPVITRRRTRRDDSPDSELSDEGIEVLPDRFDAQGRPLDRSGRPVGGRAGDSRWHTRQGDFEYRSPRGRDGLNVQGQWGIGGTDPEMVERMVRGVTGALGSGKGGWMGIVGGLLSGLQAPPSDSHGQDAVEDDDRGSSRRRRNDGRLRDDDRDQRRITERGEGRRDDRRRRDGADDRDKNDDGYDEDDQPRQRRWWKRKNRDD